MQQNNVIYEISQQIQDKQIVEKDIKEAFGLVTNLFKTKYIDKLNKELKDATNNIKNNPTKEIVLLNAIKPFMLEQNHKNIDNVINLITNMSALNNIMPKNIKQENSQNVIKINSLDPSIKEDGVYDIDESCLSHTNNSSYTSNSLIFFIFILLLFNL